MSDPFRGPPGTNPPRHVQRANPSWIPAAIALLVVLGLAIYALTRHDTTTAANPPGVTSAPAPATGVPSPAPQETTGQTAPRAK
jgi:hypothetical protein